MYNSSDSNATGMYNIGRFRAEQVTANRECDITSEPGKGKLSDDDDDDDDDDP